MQDHEFFDVLYASFTKTTGAADTYWMPEEDDEYYDNGHGTFIVWSVGEDQRKSFVGSFESEADADFLTAVHGCFPDLVRRLHAALDEADRLDVERDEREQQIGRLSLENQELREECAQLEETLATARSKAADVLWKIERPM